MISVIFDDRLQRFRRCAQGWPELLIAAGFGVSRCGLYFAPTYTSGDLTKVSFRQKNQLVDVDMKK